jgi:aryl-alcohol dehydrogenase-like predicted oxidoreductase
VGEVPAVGLGLAAVGRPAYITTGRAALGDRSVAGLRSRTHDLLDTAYAAGIRHLDVARSYGRAEEFLGGWLDTRGHDDVVVSSKWGYAYVGDWRMDAPVHEVKDHSLAQYERQRAQTAELLGDRLAIYQIHSATLDSGVLEDADVLRALAAQRDAGVAVGLSTSGPRQAETVRRALEVTVDGEAVFSCVQATWNLLERSVGDALVQARAASWGVIIKEGVANGRLTAAGDGEAGGGALVGLTALAAAHGTTPDAVALAAAVAHPARPSVLSGAVTVGQLQANLACVAVPAAVVAQALEVVRPEAAGDYWSARGHRPWS